MTDRISLDAMTSDALDQLYDRLEAAEEAARRALRQRQEMAAERYAWQERGDHAEAKITRVHALADRWILPGHISMPEAANDLREALKDQP